MKFLAFIGGVVMVIYAVKIAIYTFASHCWITDEEIVAHQKGK